MNAEHMMGRVFSTQVPGLLCGFYSKITIPVSNLVSSAGAFYQLCRRTGAMLVSTIRNNLITNLNYLVAMPKGL